MPKSDQGVHPGRYQLIPRTLIFITRNDQVLLIKGAPNKRLWANLYNGIGGHIERGEDVLSAARRELTEETGLTVPALWFCGTVLVDAGEQTGIAIFIFRGEYLSGEIQPSPEGALEWIDQDQVYGIPLVEDLPILLKKVLSMKRGDETFFGRYDYDENDRLRIYFA